jgi:hypothetical protein
MENWIKKGILVEFLHPFVSFIAAMDSISINWQAGIPVINFPL